MDRRPVVVYDEKAQRLANEMIQAEARHIAARRAEEQECDCKDGMFPRAGMTDRRKFLFAAGSLAGIAGSTAFAQAADQKAPAGAIHYDVAEDPTKEQGRAVAADGGYGSRSQFETEARWRFPTANEYTSWSMTPLDKELGNLTASGLHFERHHGGVPTIGQRERGDDAPASRDGRRSRLPHAAPGRPLAPRRSFTPQGPGDLPRVARHRRARTRAGHRGAPTAARHRSAR